MQSNFPTDFETCPPWLSPRSARNEVAVTPLQMALVAAAVANNGVIGAPRVVQEVADDEG